MPSPELSRANPSLAKKALVTLADPRLIAGRKALEAGDHAKALAPLDALLAEDPDNPVALNLRAEIDLRDSRYDEAIVRFERCLAVTPSHLSALHGLAYSHFQRARLAEAKALVDRMLTLDPVNFPARLLKAAIAALAGDHDDAALIYTGVLAERPGHFPSLVGLGHSLRTIGKTADAIAAYREAQRVSPEAASLGRASPASRPTGSTMASWTRCCASTAGATCPRRSASI